MNDLIEFLCARLDEDGQIARAALCDDPKYLNASAATADDGVWRTSTHPHDECIVRGAGIVIYDEGGHTAEQARHIALHDPARVLAEVDAKRRIIDHLTNTLGPAVPLISGQVMPPRDLLKLLALPYAGHPDYRKEWASVQ